MLSESKDAAGRSRMQLSSLEIVTSQHTKSLTITVGAGWGRRSHELPPMRRKSS